MTFARIIGCSSKANNIALIKKLNSVVFSAVAAADNGSATSEGGISDARYFCPDEDEGEEVAGFID